MRTVFDGFGDFQGVLMSLDAAHWVLFQRSSTARVRSSTPLLKFFDPDGQLEVDFLIKNETGLDLIYAPAEDHMEPQNHWVVEENGLFNCVSLPGCISGGRTP